MSAINVQIHHIFGFFSSFFTLNILKDCRCRSVMWLLYLCRYGKPSSNWLTVIFATSFFLMASDVRHAATNFTSTAVARFLLCAWTWTQWANGELEKTYSVTCRDSLQFNSGCPCIRTPSVLLVMWCQQGQELVSNLLWDGKGELNFLQIHNFTWIPLSLPFCTVVNTVIYLFFWCYSTISDDKNKHSQFLGPDRWRIKTIWLCTWWWKKKSFPHQ